MGTQERWGKANHEATQESCIAYYFCPTRFLVDSRILRGARTQLCSTWKIINAREEGDQASDVSVTKTWS
jgi:hypothetical protein